MLITIGVALVGLALIGWAVQALRLPGRGLGALSTHLQSNFNRELGKREEGNPGEQKAARRKAAA
jgi:hypothetical protein